MTHKNHKWLTALLQYAVIVCSFVSGFYTEEYWAAPTGYFPLQEANPIYKLVKQDGRSLFYSLLNTDNLIMIVGVALFAAMLCGAIFCILHLAAGDKRYAKTVLATSVLQTVLVGVCGILIANSDQSDKVAKYAYHPGALFYVMLGICAVWVAINVWACLNKKAKKPVS